MQRTLYFLFCLMTTLTAQHQTGIRVPVHADPVITIDFEYLLQPWDGFGVNYVETSQTRDYQDWPQEYGGFSLLDETERREILELIFAADGLLPGITKMFLDPFHEGLDRSDNDNDDPWKLEPKGYDHTTTTRWMRYFNQQGMAMTSERGESLTILTTLYGPPPWMTKQGYILGRDLNPAMQAELAEYMVAWVDYLRNTAELPVKYLSLHNEGEAYYRWPRDGSNPGEDHRDYNLLWTPAMVTEMLKITDKMLHNNDLSDIELTPGETQTWYRFDEWGFARALVQDPLALAGLGLITGHSFANTGNRASMYYGDFRDTAIDLLRQAKPELHAWVTSMSWGKMDAGFVDNIRRNIYISKVNGLIPWAVIQRPAQWIGGDPNPGTAIRVYEDSTYSIEPGYYFYKQVSRAGQPGMSVAAVESLDPAVGAIAFASYKSPNPDAFVIINIDNHAKETIIHVKGTPFHRFHGYRTSSEDRYLDIGNHHLNNGAIHYMAPRNSVTTFYARH